MPKWLLISVFILSTLSKGIAYEGMWIPLFLKSLNEKDMKALGMKISAEDIYSVNKGSLKDAIVHFGGGCTGEIISNKGLLLTNHHCGYGYINSHSTVEKNYMKDGFWAENKEAELACPGLFVTMIVRIEDVTSHILGSIVKEVSEKERNSQIQEKIQSVKQTIKKESYEAVDIRSFYNGNQYFAFVTVTYTDIRLVGTPPESIGKFGSDTDNWVWPRHTGDFSMFRIYADKNNMPAAYSKDNKPFTPKHFLPISLDGVEEKDFTMVFGFPGRTNQYQPSESMRQTVDVINPLRIGLRDNALKVMDKYMRQDEETKLAYAPGYAGIANSWKKWIGESQGVKFTNGLDRKLDYEKQFLQRVNANPSLSEYKTILSELNHLYKMNENGLKCKEYYAETFFRNIQLAETQHLFNTFAGLYNASDNTKFQGEKQRLITGLPEMFNAKFIKIDQEIFGDLLNICISNLESNYLFPSLKTGLQKHNNNTQSYVAELYQSSILTNPEKLKICLQLPNDSILTTIKQDPIMVMYEELDKFLAKDINPTYDANNAKIEPLRRYYMDAQMKAFPEKKFYPDANSTLRVSFGQVSGFQPKDGLVYLPKTYLDGVMEKYVPGDYEFDVPQKLIQLYKNKDYGIYGENGKMPLAFIGSNHTSGGNSGSPAIDAHGNLIGLNFDRVWEGTMSDINYDASICRNIMVDVRFVLFIVDKLGGANHLIQEMKLVHPKVKSKKKNKKAA